MIEAIANEVDSNKVDSIFHIGDISYATDFLVEWDFFIQQISLVGYWLIGVVYIYTPHQQEVESSFCLCKDLIW
jgi:hypothetical protein